MAGNTVKLPATLPEEPEAKEKAFEYMSPEEKAKILTLYGENVSYASISRIVGRPVTTVWKFLRKYQSTVKIARAHFEAKADALAKRVVKHADVDQSLEIMDRLEVLPKKRQDAASTNFQLFIGVKGSPLPLPEVVEESSKQLKE